MKCICCLLVGLCLSVMVGCSGPDKGSSCAQKSTPTPTVTKAVPGVSSQDPHGLIDKVKGMMEAHNRHDVEKELSFYADNARFDVVGNFAVQGKTELRNLFEIDSALKSQLFFTDFHVKGNTVSCKVKEQNEQIINLGLDALYYDYTQFLFKDGLIKKVKAKLSTESNQGMNRQWQAFFDWVSKNREKELVKLMQEWQQATLKSHIQ